jgi:hypothetical protein
MRNKRRSGLRIKDQGGAPEVKAALIRFARWLRQRYSFPIRVPVYLYAVDQLRTMDGKEGSAIFFAPWDRRVEPYIRIATGDFSKMRVEHGRDHALAAYIGSLAHEVIHYQQWIATGATSEFGVRRKARALVLQYSKTVDRP